MRNVKIAVFGNVKSGKTSLLKQLTQLGKHTTDYIEGNGLQFFTSFSDDVKLNFCELPNYEDDITYAYKARADCAIYCVDLSQKYDLKKINDELEQFRQLNPDAKIFAVGTFSDKYPARQDYGIKLSSITSSLSGVGINTLHQALIMWAKNARPHNNYNSAPLNNALQLLYPLRKKDILSPATALYEQLKAIYYQLDNNKKDEFGQKAYDMISVLKDFDIAVYEKNIAIQSFETYCKTSLFTSNSNAIILAKLITTFVSTVVIASIAGIIGFGIGFALGSWAGPAAFFTALISGSAAAITVASVGLGAGGLSGALIGHSLFKPSAEQNTVHDVIKQAKKLITTKPSYSITDVADNLKYDEMNEEYINRFNKDFRG